MSALDTSPEIEELRLEALRLLSPEERLLRLGQLSAMGRELVRAMIRHDYPDCSEEELRLRFAARTYGAEFARAWFNWDPEIQGY